MGSQIGIPQYKDLVNNLALVNMRDNLNAACIEFKKFAKPDAVENRESEYFEKYTVQYEEDLRTLSSLRKYAQDIADECNKTLFIISSRAMVHHIYEYDSPEDNKTSE